MVTSSDAAGTTDEERVPRARVRVTVVTPFGRHEMPCNFASSILELKLWARVRRSRCHGHSTLDGYKPASDGLRNPFSNCRRFRDSFAEGRWHPAGNSPGGDRR